MGEPMKFCPECGASMALRLGENQCTSCTYVQPAVTEAPVVRGPASGPGLPKTAKPLHTAGDLPGITPPKATGGTGFGTPESLGPQRHGPGPGLITPPPEAAPAVTAGRYIPGGIAPTDLYGVDVVYQPRRNTGGSLLIEKNIWFMVTALSNGVMVVLYLLAIMLGGLPPQPGNPVSPIGGFFFYVVVIVIDLGLYYWALYSDAVWAKYTCAGVSLIYLAMLVFGSFYIIGTMSLYTQQMDAMSAGMVSTFVWTFIIFSLGWVGWFVSILIRDSQLQSQ